MFLSNDKSKMTYILELYKVKCFDKNGRQELWMIVSKEVLVADDKKLIIAIVWDKVGPSYRTEFLLKFVFGIKINGKGSGDHPTVQQVVRWMVRRNRSKYSSFPATFRPR